MALAKSWEMRPAPAIPHRVGSNADIFQIFLQVSRKNIIQIQPKVAKQTFSFSPQISNPQIFGIVPLSQISDVCQSAIANLVFMVYLQIANFFKILHNSVSKVVF
jgi:hypothetical protein